MSQSTRGALILYEELMRVRTEIHGLDFQNHFDLNNLRAAVTSTKGFITLQVQNNLQNHADLCSTTEVQKQVK